LTRLRHRRPEWNACGRAYGGGSRRASASRGALTLDARTLDESWRRAAWRSSGGTVCPGRPSSDRVGRLPRRGRPGKVSDRARERGRRQLGTLPFGGGGTIFLEVQVVARSRTRARRGSRPPRRTGDGDDPHGVTRPRPSGAARYRRRGGPRPLRRHGIRARPPARRARRTTRRSARTISAPCGRPRLRVRQPPAPDPLGLATSSRGVLGGDRARARGRYDVAHNIAKVEEARPWTVFVRRLTVHRKGATRAFPGQPVIVPGDMAATPTSWSGRRRRLRETFGSTCHGAWPCALPLRGGAAARADGASTSMLRRARCRRACHGQDALAEEMPEAYKDVKDRGGRGARFGFSLRVARLRPLGVIKRAESRATARVVSRAVVDRPMSGD